MKWLSVDCKWGGPSALATLTWELFAPDFEKLPLWTHLIQRDYWSQWWMEANFKYVSLREMLEKRLQNIYLTQIFFKI